MQPAAGWPTLTPGLRLLCHSLPALEPSPTRKIPHIINELRTERGGSWSDRNPACFPHLGGHFCGDPCSPRLWAEAWSCAQGTHGAALHLQAQTRNRAPPGELSGHSTPRILPAPCAESHFPHSNCRALQGCFIGKLKTQTSPGLAQLLAQWRPQPQAAHRDLAPCSQAARPQQRCAASSLSHRSLQPGDECQQRCRPVTDEGINLSRMYLISLKKSRKT